MLKNIFLSLALAFSLLLVASPKIALAEDTSATEDTTTATTEETATVPEESSDATTDTSLDLETSDPSVLPGSFWYPFKKFFESVQEKLTIKPESKAAFYMQIANERLSEIKKMAKLDKTEKIDQVIAEYKEKNGKAKERLDKIDPEKLTDEQKKKLEVLKEKFDENGLRHIAVLERVRDQVPEKAGLKIQENIDAAKNRLSERLEKMTTEEKDATEKRLESIIEKIGDEEGAKADAIRILKNVTEKVKDETVREKIKDLEEEQAEKIKKIEEARKEVIEKALELKKRTTEIKDNAMEKIEEAKEAVKY
ncbi:hypothetical protein HYV44_02885 [Candidatus Microgenomates bacterium]|nr:hypothetical protein [Candidatus Microgenomates bacterium]